LKYHVEKREKFEEMDNSGKERTLSSNVLSMKVIPKNPIMDWSLSSWKGGRRPNWEPNLKKNTNRRLKRHIGLHKEQNTQSKTQRLIVVNKFRGLSIDDTFVFSRKTGRRSFKGFNPVIEVVFIIVRWTKLD
jgi:hypothetical protein